MSSDDGSVNGSPHEQADPPADSGTAAADGPAATYVGELGEREVPMPRMPVELGSGIFAPRGTFGPRRVQELEREHLRGAAGPSQRSPPLSPRVPMFEAEDLRNLESLESFGYSEPTTAAMELEMHKMSFLRGFSTLKRREQANATLMQVTAQKSLMNQLNQAQAMAGNAAGEGVADLSSMASMAKQQLEASHGAGEESEELSLRLQMLHTEQFRVEEMGNLRRMLDGAEAGETGRSSSSSSSSRDGGEPGETGRSSSSSSGIKQTMKRRGPQLKKVPAALVKLDAIDEGDNEVGSEDSSRSGSQFNVSSMSDTSGDNLGDLDDVDENDIVDAMFKENLEAKKDIQRLRDEVAQHKKTAQDLAIETAANKAHYESKILRLTQQLDQEHKNHAMTREKLLSSTDESLSESVNSEEQDSQQLEMAKMLEAAQVRNASLQEGKRIAEARVEDLKRAVALQQQKRKQVAEELMQRFPNTKGGAGGTDAGGEPANISELLDLRSRLKSTEEDKNVLINTFEGKEVHWQTQIENAQLEMDEMRRRHAEEIQKLENMVAQQEKEPVTEKRTDGRPKSPYKALGNVGDSDELPSVLSFLRCPSRAPTGGPKPAFCQEFCWKVLSAVTGKLVLWCNVRDYTILEASREANVVWGSSLLVGKSIFSLASGPSSAAWLKKAFHCHLRMTENSATLSKVDVGSTGASGFIVRGLGCEAFVSKTGEPFDSSVMMAYFPAEPSCSRPAALLVVIDPLKGGSAGHPAAGGKPPMKSASRVSSSGIHGSQRRLHPRSSHSEVSQSSVTPSDSASNVLGF